MIEINVSTGKQYYTQRNNKIRPLMTCNTTSMIMGLTYSGIKLPETIPPDLQYEDVLTDFLLTDPMVNAYYEKLFPAEYKKYVECDRDPTKSFPPNELHAILAYGTNLWLGAEHVKFHWDTSIKDILFDLLHNKAVVQSGYWNNLHHITCIVGFTTKQEDILNIENSDQIIVSAVQEIIMDDPFGDYHSKYASSAGNDIRVSFSDYLGFTKPQGKWNKWAHRFV